MTWLDALLYGPGWIAAAVVIWQPANHLYAWLGGYFWTRCPLCGGEFGGHQWRDIGGKASSIPDPDRSGAGTAICPGCTRAGLGYRAVSITNTTKERQ